MAASARRGARQALALGRLTRLGMVLAAVASLAAHPVRAQDLDTVPVEGGPRHVAGRVVRPAGHDVEPVGGQWVTLHRVGTDTAGPIDSIRTGRDGRFRFAYRASGRRDAIYFVSAKYSGIAYFTAPLQRPDVAGDEAEITVFDTTSGPIALQVRGRHAVVSASAADERRTVIEVYELSNDTSVTLVAGGAKGERASWSAAIPATATDFRVNQGDIAAEAVTARSGRVLVFAPFPPGIKQLSFSYTLPKDAFPLTFQVERPTSVLEVLIEEPNGRASGGGLAEVPPVTVDGRSFHRFLAQDVAAGVAPRVDLPLLPGAGRQRYVGALLGLLGLAMLASLGVAFNRRADQTPSPARGPAPRPSDALAARIAALDAAFERNPAPSEEDRASYMREREALKSRLATVLAGAAADV